MWLNNYRCNQTIKQSFLGPIEKDTMCYNVLRSCGTLFYTWPPNDDNGVSVCHYEHGNNNKIQLASILDMNVFVVGYEPMPKLGFGKVYQIKNARSMIEGIVYSVSIKQNPWCTCSNNESRNLNKMKWWSLATYLWGLQYYFKW
jgi:hypothetical protein